MGDDAILTINAGSSSIKFAVFAAAAPLERLLDGQVERIGEPNARIVAKRQGGNRPQESPIQAATHAQAAHEMAEYLHAHLGPDAIAAIGHRIVHGGLYLLEHQRITPAVVEQLRAAQPLDMAHLPRQIALIEAFERAYPHQPQIACFDTAFFRDLPAMGRLLPIPRAYLDAGIRRFGFHGLSYTYLMQRLGELAPQASRGKVILAHLGAGASMAAIDNGRPIDTTMAFTPTAGLVMATRPGDFDPGLLVHLMRQEKWTPNQADEFISQRCGLLGLSRTSGDMRDLLARRGADPRAAEAVDYFCHQAAKQAAAMAAAMGGVQTLVFAGGIGEHAPEIRAEICRRLEFAGVRIDSAANAANAPVISKSDSPVTIHRIETDEEIVIARSVLELSEKLTRCP